MPISLMVDYRSLSQSQLQLLANRGDAHAARFIGRAKENSRQSIDCALSAPRLAGESRLSIDKTPSPERRVTDAEAAKRSETFLNIARNLGLPPYSSFSQPPRVSDGGPSARPAKDVAKHKLDPFAPPEPLSAKEKAARKQIFKNLGLQVMDDADGAESEDTVYARLGLSKRSGK